MRKHLCLIFFNLVVLLLAISFLTAGIFEHEIGVNVKSFPNTDLIIRFEDTSSGEIFKSIPSKTDSGGSARVTLATDRDEVNVIVLFVENLSAFLQPDNILDEKKAGPFSTSQAITIDLNQISSQTTENGTSTEEEVLPEEDSLAELVPEQVVEEEVIEEQEVEEVEIEKGAGITGAALFVGEGYNIIYYILLLVIIGIVVFLLGRKIGLGSRKLKHILKDKDVEIFRKDPSVEFSRSKQIIEDAERKIREAQRDIMRIKNEEKLNEAKKKLIEDKKKLIDDQRELMRLRRGED